MKTLSYHSNNFCRLSGQMETLFTFGHLHDVKFDNLQKKETKELLSKWSMQDGLRAQAFYFDGKFKTYLLDNLIRDFFGSAHVMGNLLRAAEGGHFVPVGTQAEVVKFQIVPCTLITTEIFDRLIAEDSLVARTTGALRKCLPDYFQPDASIHDPVFPIEVGDQLRKLVLSEYIPECISVDDGDLQEIYSQSEKDEFLYRLFGHFVLGGSLCQYEDNLQPYIDVAKIVYKDLMTVSEARENLPGTECGDVANSKRLGIRSVVVKVSSAKNEGYSRDNLLFTIPHINNFMYVIIQPEDQMVFTLYHHVI
ncbi:unnamed protein product [Allacma fusca]|uniref:Cilia- and flagella-associated protein 300 n=1 Tax=Allacma fusca TaxID=39272 RepID=A0A8J2JD29_9HEXA|nr:unnamed protein product [Allacma fusca]